MWKNGNFWSFYKRSNREHNENQLGQIVNDIRSVVPGIKRERMRAHIK